mmetsp:Transcript_1207/g.2887  ORF Transcript_1207/g.2887 Transcript_1207/m.2887 type:complete len:200 (-) Transcript_1207:1241-1840(-)
MLGDRMITGGIHNRRYHPSSGRIETLGKNLHGLTGALPQLNVGQGQYHGAAFATPMEGFETQLLSCLSLSIHMYVCICTLNFNAEQHRHHATTITDRSRKSNLCARRAAAVPTMPGQRHPPPRPSSSPERETATRRIAAELRSLGTSAPALPSRASRRSGGSRRRTPLPRTGWERRVGPSSPSCARGSSGLCPCSRRGR